MRGALAPPRAASIIKQTAAALDAAHERGIVHRDLKPDNIMVARNRDGSDLVKVVDFGIAKSVHGSAQKVTKTGLVVGTPEYMSPEQLVGDAVDARSDTFALALVAFHTLTGSLPVRGRLGAGDDDQAAHRPAAHARRDAARRAVAGGAGARGGGRAGARREPSPRDLRRVREAVRGGRGDDDGSGRRPRGRDARDERGAGDARGEREPERVGHASFDAGHGARGAEAFAVDLRGRRSWPWRRGWRS